MNLFHKLVGTVFATYGRLKRMTTDFEMICQYGEQMGLIRYRNRYRERAA
jgi:hypothetical protein